MKVSSNRLFILICLHTLYLLRYDVTDAKGIHSAAQRTKVTITTRHVLDQTCLLLPQRGPCRGEIPMFYFEPVNQSCTDTFVWGGCQGNGNRFDSQEDCEQACLSRPGATKPPPKECFLRWDYGYCFGAEKRYYHDRTWKVCKEAIYSGCGGNQNRFVHKEQCESVCILNQGLMIEYKKSKDDGAATRFIANPFGMTSKINNRTIKVRQTSKSCCYVDLKK